MLYQPHPTGQLWKAPRTQRRSLNCNRESFDTVFFYLFFISCVYRCFMCSIHHAVTDWQRLTRERRCSGWTLPLNGFLNFFNFIAPVSSTSPHTVPRYGLLSVQSSVSHGNAAENTTPFRASSRWHKCMDFPWQAGLSRSSQKWPQIQYFSRDMFPCRNAYVFAQCYLTPLSNT